MRTRGKVDQPQAAIVKALRQAGCSVLSLASLGDGCPDLLVARWGSVPTLMEVKRAKGTLTPAQYDFHNAWCGPIYVVRTVEDALEAVGIYG